MTPTVPIWLEYVKTIGPLVVALIAGGIASVIAHRQWETAKAKVVLDLFERRLEVYNLVSDAVFLIIQESEDNIDHRMMGPFAVGLRKAKFLFGKEIYNYLEHIWLVMVQARSVSRRQRAECGGDIDPQLGKADALMAEISAFHNRFDEMVAPYMRMDQKLSSRKRTL